MSLQEGLSYSLFLVVFWKLHPLQGSFASGSGFFHASRKQKTIQLKLLFVFFWSWPTRTLQHWDIAVFQGVSKGGNWEWYFKDFQIWSFLSCTEQTVIVFTLHLHPAEAAVACPDKDPELEIWNPGHNEENHIEIRNGRKLLLSSSATVHSIHITDGGKTCWWQGWVKCAFHCGYLNHSVSCWESFPLLAENWVATGQTQL